MTTIAYDGKTLAVDSQVTSGKIVFGSTKKMTQLDNGRWFAFSGDLELMPSVVDWLNGGEKPTFGDKVNLAGVVVDKKGDVEEFSEKLLPFQTCVPWAGGSGEEIAITAMKCGKTAIEAVEIACELDIYTGGEIHSIEVLA